ncbi:3534_t:CDS:1 [Entrophospora sp. SA101]|nr:3534_t:CDS:1 [Entrophospora sp. SA101]
MRLKITLNDACNIARARNGLCLSDTYINISTPLRWKCSKDHEWDAPLDRIKYRNTWCPVCAGRHSFHLEIARKIAIDRGGLCLSIQCTATKELLQWRCSKGHEWSATYNNIIHNKNWCIKCSHRKPCTLEDAIKVAHTRNGKCLSEKFINGKSLLLWRCAVSHEWNASLESVKNKNTWCPHCVGGRPRYTLEDARKIAHDRNGKCLSEKYINSMTALLWRCSKGYEWNATFNSIKNANSWCPHCSGRYACDIDQAKQIAFSRNGECLSTSYFNNYSNLLWKCVKGHIWHATLNSIKDRNTWCPICRNKYENLCHEIVSKYLGPPSKIRCPNFLKTPEHSTGLELDIFYPEYGFAIEVQGVQHEKYIEFFHNGDPNNFIKQQARDQLKKELCEENWIALRYVWYYEDPYIAVPEHLRELGLIK